MSVSFFASVDDLSDLVKAIFDLPGITVYQTYSAIDRPLVKCVQAEEVVRLIQMGESQFSLWAASVMPPPSIRSIALVKGGKRSTIEGCGLYSLHVGHIDSSILCVSTLTWFTEVGARAKCSVQPGPESVDWAAHKKLGAKLQSLVRRKLQVASVSGRAVLPAALRAHQNGALLKEHRNSPYEYSASETRP
jgi:hypothetical protein